MYLNNNFSSVIKNIGKQITNWLQTFVCFILITQTVDIELIFLINTDKNTVRLLDNLTVFLIYLYK